MHFKKSPLCMYVYMLYRVKIYLKWTPFSDKLTIFFLVNFFLQRRMKIANFFADKTVYKTCFLFIYNR